MQQPFESSGSFTAIASAVNTTDALYINRIPLFETEMYFRIFMRFKKTQSNLFGDPKIVLQSAQQREDLLVVKGNELHRLIILLVMAFVVVYAGIGFLQGHILPSLIILGLFPFTLISYFVFKSGFAVASKVINLIFISTCIALITWCYGPTSFAQAFFIPVMASTLIVFQGAERKLGILLAGVVFIFFLLVMGLDIKVGNQEFSEEQLKDERMMNLIGASVVTLLEILVVLTLSNRIQEELMEQSSSLKATIATRDKMTAILSHDLRSPLALISSALNTLVPDLQVSQMEKELLQELTHRADATLVMVDNLLLWSRAQTNQIAFQPEEIHLSDLQKMMQNFMQLHQSKKVHVVFDIPREGSVMADRNLLQIILRNLFSNAVKFSYENGTISLSVAVKDTQAEVILSDTGTGMDAEQAEQIRMGGAFSTTGTQNESGNGIGLQVVREFLKMHGAALSIQSAAGKGSSFSFVLPLAKNG